jgi:hypothetical protein
MMAKGSQMNLGDEGKPRVARSDPRAMEAAPLRNFADEEAVSICKEIGAPLDPEHRNRLRKQLVEAGAFYRMSTDSFAQTRDAQVLREARELAKIAQALADRIECMSSRTKFSAAARSGKLAERHGR